MVVSVELTPHTSGDVANPQVHVRAQTSRQFQTYGAFMIDNTQIQSFRAVGGNPNASTPSSSRNT